MADRLIVMEGGRMLQIGSPKELYNTPGTAFVATFLGETSSFRGVVESDREGVAHVVMDDDFRATFRHREDVSVGDRVMVSIRPEAVTVTPERPDGKENVVAGHRGLRIVPGLPRRLHDPGRRRTCAHPGE